MRRRRSASSASLWVLLLLLCGLASAQDSSNGKNHSGIAARINGEIITWDEIELRMRSFPQEERSEDLRRAELRMLAEERLFLQFAKKYNINVTEQDVDEAIKRDKKRLESDEAFEAWLKVLNMKLSQYREERRKRVMIDSLYRRLAAEAIRNPNIRTVLLWDVVSPDELRQYYKDHPDQFGGVHQVTFWRIALTFQDDQERQIKRRLAESLLRKIAEGTDFVVLARYYSDVDILLTDGKGKYVTDANGKMVPRYRELKREESEFGEETNRLLFDETSELKQGQASAIIEDRNTLNLFKLESRLNQKNETFEEAQLKIRAHLESRKREENRIILRDALLKQSYVQPADLFK